MESTPEAADHGQQDRTARTIIEALHPLIGTGELRIPHGGIHAPACPRQSYFGAPGVDRKTQGYGRGGSADVSRAVLNG